MESEFLVMQLQLMMNWEQTRETEVQQSKGENDTKNARILLICLFNFHVSLETENLKKSEILQLQKLLKADEHREKLRFKSSKSNFYKRTLENFQKIEFHNSQRLLKF
ncbi:hypothetical protein T12_16004 [Trichinella patagoniensis]|uniref:Uncharacterized protein n=1 Tax=Trichinella patagoniensis TaxID=990121 RepID=A0A0V1AFW0_9BILA|nr:hypothetical protein T12_16004 [Trichinella patagoniensis]